MLSVPLIFNWARSNVTDGAVSIKLHTLIQSSLESSLAYWVALSNKIKLYVYKQINLIYLVLSLIISFFSVAPLVASHTSQLISGWGGAGTSEQHRKTAARLHFTTECSLFLWYLHISQLSLPFLLMNDQPTILGYTFKTHGSTKKIPK